MNFDIEVVKTYVMAYAPSILAAIAILLIGRIIAGLVHSGASRFLRKSRMDEMLVGFISNIIYGLLMAFVVIAALGQLGVETTSVIAILGAAGLAVGLALQGSLSNFAAGVMILVFRPFRVGDYIEGGGVAGTVKELTMMATVLHKPDNVKIIVPNSQLMDGPITNFSINDTRRLDMVFGIGYGDDIRHAKDILADLIAQDSRFLAEPQPVIAVSELGDSSVNLIVRPWLKTTDYWAAKWDYTQAVKESFDAAGITIPYPQQDVHVHQQ